MTQVSVLKKCVGFAVNCRGVAAVEFAFIFPALLLFVFGAFVTAQMVWTENTLQYAVEQAARCAVVYSTTTCSTPAQIESYAASQAYGIANVSAGTFSSNPSAACGQQVSASLAYEMLPLLTSTVTLTASSCRPI